MISSEHPGRRSYHGFALANYIGFRDKGKYWLAAVAIRNGKPQIAKTIHLAGAYKFCKALYD